VSGANNTIESFTGLDINGDGTAADNPSAEDGGTAAALAPAATAPAPAADLVEFDAF
jgi:hypothetical protein